MLYYHLYKVRGDHHYLQKGLKWLEDALKRTKGRQPVEYSYETARSVTKMNIL